MQACRRAAFFIVLTRCHVTEINYVDRGAAARAPLQYRKQTNPDFERVSFPRNNKSAAWAFLVSRNEAYGLRARVLLKFTCIFRFHLILTSSATGGIGWH